MKIFKILLTITGFLFLLTAEAQVTYEDNNPSANSPLGYLGWNDISNTDLDIKQNSRERMKFSSIFWPGYNGAPFTANASRIFLSIDGTETMAPFSMMHLGYEIEPTLYRPWMNVGTTYGAGIDIMYTGILQSPGNSNNELVTDAVVAWGCQDEGPSADNFRFLFIKESTGNPDDQGLETMLCPL